MQRRRYLRPSPAMVVACLALLVALSGTSIAAVSALPPNSVGTVQAPPVDAYSKYRDGPITVPGIETTLASLTIPKAGKYVIVAKAYVTTTENSNWTNVLCVLSAGGDNDSSAGGNTSQYASALALNVVHQFAGAGSVALRCVSDNPAYAHFIKITAIRVGTLTNSG